MSSHGAQEEELTDGSCTVSTRRTRNSARSKGGITAIAEGRSNSRLRKTGSFGTVIDIADVGISIRRRCGLVLIRGLDMAGRVIEEEADWGTDEACIRTWWERNAEISRRWRRLGLGKQVAFVQQRLLRLAVEMLKTGVDFDVVILNGVLLLAALQQWHRHGICTTLCRACSSFLAEKHLCENLRGRQTAEHSLLSARPLAAPSRL